MPNIKSSIKRVKIARKKNLRNTAAKSALRTSIKKCKEAIANNSDSVEEILRQTISDIDKAVTKNILHKNNAARKKSRLMKAFKAIKAASAAN
ncbi:MAG TPA: 30S ribosomal protein S20 [Clostridiaceae bacterium]|nr:30S ribosomal protein S20 [Clostridiaceae bacterium]